MGIFHEADVDADGEVTKLEFLQSLKKPSVICHLHEVNIDVRQAEGLFDILDYDESGSLDAAEFIEGVMTARGEAKAKDVLAVQCDLWKAERKIMDSLDGLSDSNSKTFNDFNDAFALLRKEVEGVKEAIYMRTQGEWQSSSGVIASSFSQGAPWGLTKSS